jgi:imidazolonepropionase-like amidohydrolase
METAQGIATNAAYCAKKGVLVSLNSDSGPQMQYLFNEAAKAVKYGGLSREEALKLITLNPAIQLGVEKIAGSLEIGKHGDIAIFNKHPLDSYTRCEMTIIEGEIYFDRQQYLEDKEKQKKKKKEDKKDKGGKK